MLSPVRAVLFSFFRPGTEHNTEVKPFGATKSVLFLAASFRRSIYPTSSNLFTCLLNRAPSRTAGSFALTSGEPDSLSLRLMSARHASCFWDHCGRWVPGREPDKNRHHLGHSVVV